MAEANQPLAEPLNPNTNPNFAFEFDEFFNAVPPDGLNFENGVEFDDIELTFDNLEDLYFPDVDEDFVIPEIGDSGSSEVSGDRDVGKFLNWGSPENGGRASSHGSGNCGSPESDGKVLGCGSPENGEKVLSERSGNCGSLQSGGRVLGCASMENGGTGGPLSSQGSGNCESMNVSSGESENCVDQKVKVKVEDTGKMGVSKRKKRQDEGNAAESRINKCRREGSSGEDGNSGGLGSGSGSGDVDEKKIARLLRNRESAQLSRQRKKQHVEELEEKVRLMNSTIADLNNRISYVMAENATLRQQLSGSGMCPAPPPGMYPPPPPMGPMGYPWMPYSPYVVKPQGSQVPLVPIPRLKPQQPASAAKVKKSESKKGGEGKTRKVASVTFLGLLFFILLFGGLVPFVNVRFGGLTDQVPYVSNRIYDQHRGRVLTVDGHLNGSMGVRFPNDKVDINNRIHDSEGAEYHVKTGAGNSSEPLVASLYVPRNDKLVKIDGNLIINSVLASDKAAESQVNSKAKNREETGLAIRNDLAAALAIPEFGRNQGRHPHVYRNPSERQRALASGSTDTLKEQTKSNTDGRLQQWFRDGLAGPMLSSGMCTEVFQFDVSPGTSSGAIVPASAVSNVSAEQRQNATHLNKGMNRRILRNIPVPLPGSSLNITDEQMGKSSHRESFQGNKSGTSMVVSVLIDPREAGDSGDVDNMVAPKSLSRIFVVVLLDSVKYVTYSCMLPRIASHLVTA